MELPKLLEKLNLPPNSYVSIGETFESIVWTNKPEITKEFFDNKVAELQTEYNSQAYSRNRQQNYPNEHDLLVALWEKVIEGRSESADALEIKRQEVKTAHPKPE